jgi:glycerol-3-phosphate O-acyltransferase
MGTVKLPTPLVDEPAWPAAAGRVVFLLDASSGLEDAILRDWIARARPAGVPEADVEVVSIPPSRRRRRRRLGRRASESRLEACVAASGEALFAPLRVAWRVPERDGVREVRWSDLVTSFGDPRDPGPLRQRRTLRRHAERCRIVAGAPAHLAELRERWTRISASDDAATLGLAEFVARQAALALDRAERRMRGARYKVPRFVHEDILGRPAVRGGLARLAREQGKPEPVVLREGARYLREIAASHSPFVIDLAAPLIRALWSQGYRNLRFDRQRLEAVAALGQRHPIVFMPSHKSNLDHLVLQYALHVSGLPPNHTAGGINMNFFPVGPLVRRAGVFFIRRTFKDNPVYKFVLRQYVDYLIEKRFPLEWYVEGGRSRSGKLLPPRFGLLAYVVDAWRRGKAEDVYLIPVSIAYDQISDVGDYAAEQRGGAKERESFGWFVRVVRRLRRRYGDIHLRFGEALSLTQALARLDLGEPDVDAPDLAVQKLAFEVCARINRVTPITPTSLVTLTLLGTGNRAVTVDEIMVGMRNLLGDVRRRKLHTTRELEELETPDGVRRALDVLRQSGVVSCFEEGPEAVYAIERDQHHAAAYYRNSIAHFFVNGAIAELALLHAAEKDADDATKAFWAEALRLRDLLKFEFFFADRERFRAELRDEMAQRHAAFEERLREGGGEEVRRLIRETWPYGAHRVLRPFLDAYYVVADTLRRRPVDATFEQAAFLDQCLRVGRQYLLQRRVLSPESVSKMLFETGLRLARNRGLVELGTPDLAERRKAFADEIRDALRRVEIIEALAAARRAGMTD